jgi:hypothetical protein
MAGKTFPGIGDLEDEVPPLDPADAADSSDHSQSNYSGPTVVDDAKVEQGLKKLRSLDAAPTDIQQAITEVLGDPTRATPPMPVAPELLRPEITIDPGRGTAVGRSVSGPVVGQQTTQPVDDRALRGTMFGHGVHLPDLEEARRAMLVETSKALAVVERGVPTTNEITVFQPGTYPQHADIPRAQEPYPRSSRAQAQDTPIELRTVLPRNTLIMRVVATGAGVAAIVVAALFWVRSTDEADLNARSSVANPLPRAPKPVEVQPIVAAPAPPSPPPTAPAPAPAVQPAAVTPAPVAPADVDAPSETKRTRPSNPPPPTARHSHASSSHSERHHAPPASEAAAGAIKPDESAKPERPERSSRAKRAVEEDPDGTMAPTIE